MVLLNTLCVKSIAIIAAELNVQLVLFPECDGTYIHAIDMSKPVVARTTKLMSILQLL